MTYNPEHIVQNNAQSATIQQTDIGDSEGVALFLKNKDLINKVSFENFFSALRYQLRYATAYIVQGVCYPIFYVVYHSYFDLQIEGKEKLKNIKEPAIFISNHIGFYDSFIFDLFVPPFSKIPPFRFMGTMNVGVWYLKVFKYTGILYLVFLMFGVIKVTYGKGAEVATLPAVDVIKRGGTVAIFPEGKIWRQSSAQNVLNEPIGPFKWGAAIMAKKTGALVVPVALNKDNKKMFRDKILVTIGEPYRVDTSDTPEELADEMREKVKGLYSR